MFDSTKTGQIEMEKVRTILRTMGHNFDDEELEALLEEENRDGQSIHSRRHVNLFDQRKLSRGLWPQLVEMQNEPKK